MIIQKEVLILGEKWYIEYKTYSNGLGNYGNAKFQLILYCLEDRSKNVLMFNNWKYIYVYTNHYPTATVCNNIKDAKIEVLKYFFNES